MKKVSLAIERMRNSRVHVHCQNALASRKSLDLKMTPIATFNGVKYV